MGKHTVYRGDTVPFRIEVKDYLGAPVDITGWVFFLSVAQKKGGIFNCKVAGTIDDAANGVVLFELTPEQTASVGKYFYDVESNTNLGKIHTLDSGEIEIIQDVTLPNVGDGAIEFPDFTISASG